MAEKKSAKTRPYARRDSARMSAFNAQEHAAMKERVRETRSTGSGKGDGESDVLAAIAKMKDASRAIAERLHIIIKANAPELTPKTWYGMPAYANRDGKVICFFRPAEKFKERYATFGFNGAAKLDDGSMWPAGFALTKLASAEEARIAALVKKAVGK